MMKKKICIICKKQFSEFGNNPYPLADLKDGRCCDECDCLRVLPARMVAHGISRVQANEIGQAQLQLRRSMKRARSSQ
jgi:hypothetical protein